MNIYERFILKYKNQVLEQGIYSEKHHILPKYLGGDNSKENIIVLTYRQHTLAHLLLYRVYKNYEDKLAYSLMRGLELDRKQAIGKMIGEKHKQTGHIYALGKKNVESGFLASIRTKETCSAGGKIGGAIARDTGQINTIKTKESCLAGGFTGGRIARETGQIQALGKYKGLYVLIDAEGIEYQHLFQMVEALHIDKYKLSDWCQNNKFGFSRRKKTQEELKNRWKQTSAI